MEPGLGESEAFYSWVITVFNVGAILGSLSGGLLLKWVPYWHLLLGSLVLHTLGYILYAVASSGWLIMLSKLLSGIFIGAEMTLALAYFGESNSSYKTAIKELGKEDGKATRMKHQLFALHSVGINIGYVFGPGMYAVVLCFPPSNSTLQQYYSHCHFADLVLRRIYQKYIDRPGWIDFCRCMGNVLYYYCFHFHRSGGYICPVPHQPVPVHCMVQCSGWYCHHCGAVADIQRRERLHKTHQLFLEVAH